MTWARHICESRCLARQSRNFRSPSTCSRSRRETRHWDTRTRVVGKDAEAHHVLETYLEESKRTYISWYGIAFVYAGLGENDLAFACLEKAYDQQDVRLRDLNVEPLFENLRFDPRFAHLVRRVGL